MKKTCSCCFHKYSPHKSGSQTSSTAAHLNIDFSIQVLLHWVHSVYFPLYVLKLLPFNLLPGCFLTLKAYLFKGEQGRNRNAGESHQKDEKDEWEGKEKSSEGQRFRRLWIEGEFKAVDSLWLSNPADPWAVVRDWRDHGGSRSIPLSAECESSTVIPSTPYTQTHTHIYTQTPTHAHSLRSQGLGRICAVWELLRSAFQGKRSAKPQNQPNTISSWSAT